MTPSSSDAAGTFEIAGKKVPHLGFGAMRLTGPGCGASPTTVGSASVWFAAPSDSAGS
ncbi:hypothetical protein [Streptomyces rimosus]|uniref:hypothetical protein n=1 Tax=Streptomyces rimosus TaxID=1927 RepID=UPI0037CEC4E8